MKPLIVLADDLTGAAEIAGVGVEFGLTARVVRRGAALPKEVGLVVIDTDTRALPPAMAAQRVRGILERVADRGGGGGGGAPIFYKKTDSVLRGRIAAELHEILAFFHLRRALLVAQNPSKGRVITDAGEYRVEGVSLDQTTFFDDPEYPRRWADAAALLRGDSPGVTVHAARTGEAPPADGVIVAAAQTAEHVAQWARQVDQQTLAAGGADMFRALLAARGYTHGAMQVQIDLPGKAIVACGSSTDSSRATVAAWERANVLVCACGDDVFAAPSEPALIHRWAQRAAEALQERGSVVLAIRQPVVPERAALLRACMAETVRHLAVAAGAIGPQAAPLAVFIEGGATAAAIVETMGWNHLDVLGNLAPGVVAMRPVDAPQMLVVMKPGSYPWGDAVLQTLAEC